MPQLQSAHISTSTAIQSVIDIHEMIEQVFTGHHPQDLAQLLDAFHPDFKMITMTGNAVTLEDVKQLFTQKQGSRKTLKIMVKDIHILTQSPELVWLQYQEAHYEDGNLTSTPHQRRSTAGIIIKDSQWQWLYLHETEI